LGYHKPSIFLEPFGNSFPPRDDKIIPEVIMIRLVPVNKDNWKECIKLPTSEDHRHVAPNVYSIAEAQFYPDVTSACIYAGDQMVGYTMYGREDDEPDLFWIDRLMIADGQRGKGFGRQALILILEEAKQKGCFRIGLSTSPDNTGAIHLYESLGFRATGEVSDGEEIFMLNLDRGQGSSD
jgi:diamine N-acetyltransferase